MQLATSLVRESGEHLPTRELVRPLPKPKGRPRLDYEFHVRTPRDVERLRRAHNAPMVLLTPEWVSAHGHPESFRPILFVYEGLKGQVASPSFSRVLVRSKDGFQEPSLELMATFLLKVDAVAARLVLLRNRGRVNPNELYRFVRNEQLEQRATYVRLQDFAPGLPVVGETMSPADLAAVERNAPAPPLMPRPNRRSRRLSRSSTGTA
jgi:hypothetical protein